MELIVQINGITKRFPGVVVPDYISFNVQPGEIHVLLGENGTGKSTLMKVLSGAYTPDEGTIVVNGKEYKRLTPHLSAEGGISIIYQELSVVNWLGIRESIFMGQPSCKKAGPAHMVNCATMNKLTEELLAKVIVMGDSTPSLTEEEIQKLFTIIRQRKEEGKRVVFISHKLSETAEIGNRITIMKDGGYVDTYQMDDLTTDDMLRLMVGREIKGTYQHTPEENDPFGDVLFECKHLTRKEGRAKDVSFTLRKGEILGLSILVGAGHSETMCAIYGTAPISSGEVRLNGKRRTLKIRTARFVKASAL